MGELAKFGIKLGLVIATSVALVASMVLLYTSITGVRLTGKTVEIRPITSRIAPLTEEEPARVS